MTPALMHLLCFNSLELLGAAEQPSGVTNGLATSQPWLHSPSVPWLQAHPAHLLVP